MSEPNRFRRRVLVNTASTGIANAWAMVVALVSLPLMLSGMGPSAFGLWVLIQTFSAVNGWFSLADVGVGTATTRAVAEKASVDDHTAVGAIVSSGLSVFASLGVVCAAALALLGPLFLPALFHAPQKLEHALRVAIVLFAVQVMFDLLTEGFESCLEGLQRVDLSRGADALRRTLVAAATVAAAQTDGRLESVALASLGASVVGTVIGGAVLRRHLRGRVARPQRDQIWDLVRYAKTVAILRPLGVIQRTMDRLVVGAVLGPAAVAIVEIATQILNGAEAVLSASSYAVVPSAAWLAARQDHGTLREFLHRGTKYSLLATVPVAAGAAVLAGPIVRVWLGPHFEQAAGVAAVALLTTLATAPIQVGSNLLLGIGRASDILRAAAAAIVVNLVMSLVLVHITGIVGVFQATLLSCLVLVPILSRSMLRAVGSDLGTFLHDAVLPVIPPAVALVLAAGAVLAAPLSDVVTLVAGALAGGLAYLAVALRFSVHRSELDELRSLVSRGTPSG
ncbi:MAG: polysaccharide biosynthesis protein [Acidimicrobiia bacterium]|nr:polysaccharide biosynthesis protein [Acidimicrobiia bacterium]